jgi:hypothetical protein
MINAAQLKKWLAMIDDSHSIAIDDGGLMLGGFDQFNLPTGACIEVGGEASFVEDIPAGFRTLSTEDMR